MMLTMVMAALSIAPLDARCSEATEDQPRLCQSTLPAVRSITIERNAHEAWQDKISRVSCGKFVLTPRLVGQFLQQASETDQGSVHYVLAESPCQASGRVHFVDGRTAAWRIDQYAIGRFTFANDETKFLYCPNCEFAPFTP